MSATNVLLVLYSHALDTNSKSYRYECFDRYTTDENNRRTIFLLACDLDQNGRVCAHAFDSQSHAIRIAGTVVGSIFGGIALGLGIYFLYKHFKLKRFLLQFDHTKDEKKLFVDDPEDWSANPYVSFQDTYNSSSLLSPMSSSG